MRRLFPALALLAGCAGYEPATPERLRTLALEAAPVAGATLRSRVHLSLESRWLSGEFDGVVVSRPGAVRAQFFGDLGPKVFDLLATPERIVGYFPQTLEGVDCRLPSEAARHPLLFMGVTLLEDREPIVASRISGLRDEDEGTWARLRPVVDGVETSVYFPGRGSPSRRRFDWLWAGWEERRISEEERRIEAPGVRIRVRILSRETLTQPPRGAFELPLPPDLRIVQGSRK